MYTYTLLDPRPQNRGAVLATLGTTPTLGVEVTVPELAWACQLGNIDPQHLGGDPDQAAIEAAVDWPLPPEGTTLATIRPDADAFGAMAVLTLRAGGHDFTGWQPDRRISRSGVEMEINPMDTPAARVHAIGADDRTAGEWSPGQDVNHVTGVQALKAVCFDHGRTVEDRVNACISYVLYGAVDGFAEIADRLRAERREHAAVAADVTVTHGGRVAVVESTSRFAVTAAYWHAEIVVAVNPAFQFAGGPAHRKITVCQKWPGLVDLAAVFKELNSVQPGWGGSPTIGGSPQGVDCTVSTDDIVAVVAKHLR